MIPIIEQRKRDRLTAYALAHLLGDFLVPMTHPDQQRPAYVLATPLSYPQASRSWAANVKLSPVAPRLLRPGTCVLVIGLNPV